VLVLPAEAPNAILSRRLQHGDGDGLAVNLAVGSTRLLGGDGHQRVVVDRFDEAVAQRVEHRPQRPDIFRFRHMFLRLRDHRAIIDEGTSADAARAIIDGNGWIDKIAVGIRVADAQLSELAGTAGDRVLVTVGASPRVEDRSKPGIDVVCQFENLLVESEAVTGRFRDPVANAARARILDECRGIEASGRFGQGLLRRHRRDARTAQRQNDRPIFSGDDHGSSSPTHRSIRITIG